MSKSLKLALIIPVLVLYSLSARATSHDDDAETEVSKWGEIRRAPLFHTRYKKRDQPQNSSPVPMRKVPEHFRKMLLQEWDTPRTPSLYPDCNWLPPVRSSKRIPDTDFESMKGLQRRVIRAVGTDPLTHSILYPDDDRENIYLGQTRLLNPDGVRQQIEKVGGLDALQINPAEWHICPRRLYGKLEGFSEIDAIGAYDTEITIPRKDSDGTDTPCKIWVQAINFLPSTPHQNAS